MNTTSKSILRRGRLAVAALMLLILTGFAPPVSARASIPTVPLSDEVADGSPQAQQMEGFYKEVWQVVGDTYYDRTRLADWEEWRDKYDGRLATLADLELALKEMTGSLNDRWTHYTSSADIAAITFENYAGWQPLGFGLAQSADGSWKIEGFWHGSPAQESDLRHDDTIVSIGGTQLSGLTKGEVLQLTNAEKGASVEIVYIEHDTGKQAQLTLTARELQKPTVEVRAVEELDGAVYARLPEFSTQAVVKMLVELTKQNKEASIKQLIFDLRGNGGGSLDASLVAASIFLKQGNVVSTVTRDQRMTRHTMHAVTEPLDFDYLSMKGDMMELLQVLQSIPMIVLTDRSTASASEVLIGALVENNRVKTVGERTFGKGVGYTEFPLPTGGVLQITTLGYVTPSGYDLSGRGLEPHHVVTQPRGASHDAALAKAIELLESGPGEELPGNGDSDAAAAEGRDHLDVGCYITISAGIQIWVPECD